MPDHFDRASARTHRHARRLLDTALRLSSRPDVIALMPDRLLPWLPTLLAMAFVAALAAGLL